MHERASIGSIFKIKSVTHAPINGYATADRRVDHDDLKEAQLRAHGVNVTSVDSPASDKA